MNRGNEPAGHAFISYVHEDSLRVDWLQRTLEAAGIPVWRDTADLWPGEDWRAKIRSAITGNALVFIACFSRASLARGISYQNEELTLAIEQLRLRRPGDPWLIPVRLDECDIPDHDFGGGRTLASIQRADLFGDHLNENAEQLIGAVLRILGKEYPFKKPIRDPGRNGFGDRFAKAVEHLGSHSEEVRIGGIYELERIAQDAGAIADSVESPRIMSYLATFVREHSDEPWPDNRNPPYWAPAPVVPGVGRRRRSRQHPPLPDVIAALTVIGRRDSSLDDRKYLIDFSGANISLALLNELDFSGADFYQANLIGAELRNADLSRTRLVYTFLNRVTADRVKLTRANLTGADMSGASLNGADLREANLSLVDLSDAQLRRADFTGAILDGTNFKGAGLGGAVGLNRSYSL